jgi:outer membrane lipoprotein SlyB
MRGQALLAVTALSTALALAQPGAAQTYNQYPSYQDAHRAQYQDCQRVQNDHTAGGAIIGGLVGAFFGSHIAANHHRSDGAIVGAVTGATAGGLIGHQSGAQACSNRQVQGQYDPYYGQAYGGDQYADKDRYDDNSRLDGGPDDRYASNDRRGGDDCQWGAMRMRDRYGRDRNEQVWMCRDDDGVWRPAQN